jgi:two-component system, sensor histidine kinase
MEPTMPLSLTKLFDLQKLQKLLDNFYRVTGISVAVIDTDGTLLVSSARPALCAQFYDAFPRSAQSCRLSRAFLQDEAFSGQQAVSSICPHGLLDAAEPIIIQGHRIGALLMGQVFAEPPDLAFYRQEAERYQFDTEAFLQELTSVPVIGHEQFGNTLALMKSLTFMLIDQGMTRLAAEESMENVRLHSERSIKDIRRQKAQLKMYAMEHPSCNELLDMALEEALALSGSNIGYVFHYDEASSLFTLYAWSKSVVDECHVAGNMTVYELEKFGLMGEAVRQRKPIITNDYEAVSPVKKGVPKGHVPLKRHLNLPIFRNKQIVAVVGVGNKAVDYTDNDVRQLQLFMDGVWNIVERRKAEDELTAAKELAEASSRMKTELMANLSHELRTPLNGVLGGLQLLRFTELTDEQDEFLGMVEEAAANELTLVNNLLELVRLEAEGVQVAHGAFSLRQCVDETMQAHDSVARQKGLTLLQELPTDLPTELIGDKVRIRQILHSLVGNAIKFTEQGTVTLGISVEAGDNGTMLTRFGVTDTGIGIEPEKLAGIFELFIQSDMSNTRRFGGLGLGLTICNRLAAAMGGCIRAESVPGKGSSFYLELPLELPAASRSDKAAARQLLILLVEDDYLSSLTSERLLRKLGHNVVTSFDGKDAVEKWKRTAFDLILMDIQMPIMTGFEALQQIRHLEHELGKPRVMVVAQTAYARWNYQESCMSDGFDGFIAKPLMREELEAVIDNLCG